MKLKSLVSNIFHSRNESSSNRNVLQPIAEFDDILLEIFLFLPVSSLSTSIFLLNKHMYSISNDDNQWRRYYLIHLKQMEKISVDMTWKDSFKEFAIYRWTDRLLTSDKKLIHNCHKPIIESLGKSAVTFPKSERRQHKVVHLPKVIPLSGKSVVSFNFKSRSRKSLGSNYILIGILHEKSLLKCLQEQDLPYFGYLTTGELEVTYANNGYLAMNSQQQFSTTFDLNDIVSIEVNADFHTEDKSKFGQCTFLVNGKALDDEYRYSGLFRANEKYYFCVQLSEESGNDISIEVKSHE
jgi:hypothetical protein